MSERRLCARCQEIFSVGIYQDDPWERIEHLADSEAFFRAVEHGCYICSWTWRNHIWSESREHRTFEPVHHTAFLLVSLSEDQSVEFTQEGDLGLFIYVYCAEGILESEQKFWLLNSAITGNCPSLSLSLSLNKLRPMSEYYPCKVTYINQVKWNIPLGQTMGRRMPFRACRMPIVNKWQ
jgi:hypothetical protein